MAFLSELWLPILLSAVFVFVVSSIIHMATPMHKADYAKLPGEAEVLASIRAQGVRPGGYMFPFPPSMKEMCSPEMTEKFKQGPVGHLRVLQSGVPNMGKHLLQWFLFSVLVGVFVAYAAWYALGPGAPYLVVFRVAGAVAFLGYGATHVVSSIWKGERWGVTAKFLFDGALYGLVTAGTFGWLWPEAAGV